MIGFRNWIVSGLIFGFHGAGREAAEKFVRRSEGGFDAFQDVGGGRRHKVFVTSPARAFARPSEAARCREYGAATEPARACSDASPTALRESIQSTAKSPGAGRHCLDENGESR